MTDELGVYDGRDFIGSTRRRAACARRKQASFLSGTGW